MMLALVLVMLTGFDDGRPSYKVVPLAYNLSARDCLLRVGVSHMIVLPETKIVTCEPMERWG